MVHMGEAQGSFANAVIDFAPGTLANAFSTTPDPALSALADKAALASTPAAESGYEQQLTARLDQLAWSVPVATVPVVEATSSRVANVPSTFLTLDMDPFSPVASQAWQAAS